MTGNRMSFKHSRSRVHRAFPENENQPVFAAASTRVRLEIPVMDSISPGGIDVRVVRQMRDQACTACGADEREGFE